MIKKLQHRFIRIALLSLSVAMMMVVLLVNTFNWFSVRNELQETLAFLQENSTAGDRNSMNGHMIGKNKHARNLISESNWFSVSYDQNGVRRNMNLINMTDPDESMAADLSEQAVKSGKKSGFLQEFLYGIRENSHGETTVLFLNCETKLASVRTLAVISCLACIGGILTALALVTLASRRAIEPMIQNMEKQKQFITNASHELKTPLTVIATNMDLLHMEQPDNPWVKSTQKQTAQMRHLVEELVYLSRMEEENAPLTMESLSLMALLRETAEPFQVMAEYQGKNMSVTCSEGLTLWGDRASIQRLLSTLFDNAVKYAKDNGNIRVDALGEGKNVLITVSNEVAQILTEEQCRQLFDRFYRTDASRNKEKQSGFGIGLSIAAAIVEKHGGALSAAMEKRELVFSCRLPRGGIPPGAKSIGFRE